MSQATDSSGTTLLKQTTLYTLGIAVTRFANLLLLPLYLHTLTKADYGALGVLEQLVQLLVILTMAGGMETLVKIGTELRSDQARLVSLVSTSTTWMMISGLAIAGLGAVCWPVARESLGGIGLWPHGVIALLTVPAFSAFQAMSAYLQLQGRARAHTLFQALRTLVNVLVGVPLLLFTQFGVTALLLAACASYWLTTLVLLREMPAGMRPLLDFPLLKRVLRYGIPLMPHIAAVYIFQSLDKFMLAASSEHGLEVAGIYSVGSRIASGAMMLGLGMQRAWLPFFFEEAKQGDAASWQRVRQLSFWSMAGMASFVALLSLTAPEVVGVITPSGYTSAAAVTSVLCLGTLFRTGAQTVGAVVLSNEAHAYRIWLASIPAAVVNVVLNWLWIPRLGALGACWATTLAMGLNMLLMVAISRAVLNVPFRYGASALLLLVTTLLVVTTEHSPFWLRLLLCGVVPALSVALDWRFVREELARRLPRRAEKT